MASGQHDLNASALNILGLIAYYEGDEATAEQRFGESLAIRRDIGDRRGVSVVLEDLARMSCRRGELDAARAHAAESLGIHLEIGQNTAIPDMLETAAAVLAATGAPALAAQLFGSAEALRELIHVPMTPDRTADYAAAVASLAAALGEQSLDSSWRAGRALTWEAAAREAASALGRPDASSGPRS